MICALTCSASGSVCLFVREATESDIIPFSALSYYFRRPRQEYDAGTIVVWVF